MFVPWRTAARRLAPHLSTRNAPQSYAQQKLKYPGSQRGISAVPNSGHIDVESFRQDAFIPAIPYLIRSAHELAAKRWFAQKGESSACLSSHLMQYSSTVFPFELLYTPDSGVGNPFNRFVDWLRSRDEDLADHLTKSTTEAREGTSEDQDVFCQFYAPLKLLSEATIFNGLAQADDRLKRLYIAQSQLNELPQALLDDLPVPDLVKQAGKGDIYDSSIWLGLEPTYTPLHRDPNPNLFVQILSGKTVRLLTPATGQQLYAQVRRQIGSGGNSHFRGSEMMQGPERRALYKAVWGKELSHEIHEAVLGPGDALFIPKGWWHSVQSNSNDARLNASVNWWFR